MQPEVRLTWSTVLLSKPRTRRIRLCLFLKCIQLRKKDGAMIVRLERSLWVQIRLNALFVSQDIIQISHPALIVISAQRVRSHTLGDRRCAGARVALSMKSVLLSKMLFRPCMIGSAANQRGSRYCQLCPDGYTTFAEGAAHCTVPVESTDLSRYYAVIASFDVVLNGTSLEEIERLGACKRALMSLRFE